MATQKELSLRSIDDYLGSADGRFFGSGYRRVAQRLTNIVVDVDECGRSYIAATASISVPEVWSRKGSGTVTPHLSTIDALVFAAQLVETYCTDVFDLDEQARCYMWLRRVEIRAGVKPVEDGLHTLPVSAVLRETAPAEDGLCDATSTFDCRIGPMIVRCEVEHDLGHDGPVTRHHIPDDVVGPDLRPYGSGYREHRQAITDVVIDPRTQRARAIVGIDLGTPATEGMEGGYGPTLSMVDAFVVALQLGQVLLYELDGVTRADSNTLWMRHTVLEATSPLCAVSDPFPVTVGLDDSMLLSARGGTWRTSTVVTECHGLRVKCAVTHEIPRHESV